MAPKTASINFIGPFIIVPSISLRLKIVMRQPTAWRTWTRSQVAFVFVLLIMSGFPCLIPRAMLPHGAASPAEQQTVAPVESVRIEVWIILGREHRVDDASPVEEEEVAVIHHDFFCGNVLIDLPLALALQVVRLRHRAAVAECPALSDSQHRHDHSCGIAVRSHEGIESHAMALDVVRLLVRDSSDAVGYRQKDRMDRMLYMQLAACCV